MDKPGVHIFNLGKGQGTSVMELLKCFEKENEVQIPYAIRSRREGDLPAFWADVDKARTVLGWEAEMSLQDMVRHAWQWQKNYTHETSGTEYYIVLLRALLQIGLQDKALSKQLSLIFSNNLLTTLSGDKRYACKGITRHPYG